MSGGNPTTELSQIAGEKYLDPTTCLAAYHFELVIQRDAEPRLRHRPPPRPALPPGLLSRPRDAVLVVDIFRFRRRHTFFFFFLCLSGVLLVVDHPPGTIRFQPKPRHDPSRMLLVPGELPSSRIRPCACSSAATATTGQRVVPSSPGPLLRRISRWWRRRGQEEVDGVQRTRVEQEAEASRVRREIG